jgi:hypothetical protein
MPHGRVVEAVFSTAVTSNVVREVFSKVGTLTDFVFDEQSRKRAILQFANNTEAQHIVSNYNQQNISKNCTVILQNTVKDEIARCSTPLQSPMQDIMEDDQVEPVNYVSYSSGWVFLTDNNHIESYLQTHAPSKLYNNDNLHWISVKNATKKQANMNFNLLSLLSEWEPMKRKSMPVSVLEDLARKHNLLCGKWMVFVKTSHVDEIWKIIAKATVQGLLGHTSKVATSMKGSEITHVICIYTSDYLDLEERKNVALALKGALKNTEVKRISYKPDLYTHLKIYKGHPTVREIIDEMKW